MNLTLTKKQYECLIRAIEASSSVYGILGDVSDDYKKKSDEIENLRSHLLSFASEFGAEHIVEKFHNQIILSDGISKKLEEVIDDYNDENFWHELEIRLGKRDFERTITEKEKKEIKENGGWYPDRIQKIYDEWAKEFEKNGVN